MDKEVDWTGDKITIMGLGLLGRGVGDAEFFAAAGANLIVTDLRSAEDLAPSIARLKKYENIVYHLGGHRMEDFENRDLIIRAPNAPLDSPYLANARAHGIRIEMDGSLFAKLTDATTIGVTGTRGKSTVNHLIYEILKADGKTAYIGGNERDTASLQLLSKISSKDIAVLELDSWQLQGFEEDKISPHIAAWTNFMPDHMNYYRGDMDRYFQDKASIARFQKKGDFFIAPKEIKEKIEARFGELQATCITDITIPSDWTVALEGAHNRANAGIALAVARCLGVADAVTQRVLGIFHGLPYRLQLLGDKHGITFYNDSNSTTPDASIAALWAVSAKKKPIVLIAGGSDKELTFTELAHEITRSVKHVVLLKGGATEKLRALLPTDFPVSVVNSMDEAFSAAIASATQGDTILLSPGATSFGLFKNEYDRAEQFEKLYEQLK